MHKNSVMIGAPFNDINPGTGSLSFTDEGSAYIFEPCDTAITSTVATCDSLISPSGKYTWYNSGQYQDTVIYGISTNCDIYYTVNLTIGTPQKDSISVSSCDTYTTPSGKYTYSTSGIVNDTISTVANCDSIITINLTILNSSTAQINSAACSSYTSPSGRYIWQTS